MGVLIRDLICEMMIRRIKDPRIRLATITGVEMESNLRVARVYYSVQGDEGERRSAEEGIKSARGYIKRELAHALGIRFMPEIIFEFDSSMAHAQRIGELLTKEPGDLHDGKFNG